MKKVFFVFGLLLTVSTATVVFNSCSSDKKDEPKETPTDPTDPTKPVTGADTTDVGMVIRGVKWATRNVDAPGTFAKTSRDAGMFYQWNRKLGWKASETLQASDGSTTWDSSNAGGSTWEKINDPCPCGWRVPTSGELQSLVSAGSVWDDSSSATLPGRLFGTAPNTLFLPAAGYRYSSTSALSNAGSDGYYWSSTVASTYSYGLGFASGGVSPGYVNDRANGFSVRCVAE